MSSPLHRGARLVRLLTLALAVIGLTGLTAVALARTAVLAIAAGAPVTNASGHTVRESIATTPRGRAVYTLSGDSRRHPECTSANGCFGVWPPVTVTSAHGLTKPAHIAGRLTVWHRGAIEQLVLGGHPLYTFAGDQRRRSATGQGLVSFGGTWRVVRAR